MRYRCCDLGDSSYCPENRGEVCMNRIQYDLDPNGGNEKKIEKINQQIKRSEEIKWQDATVVVQESDG